jgi:hypothetical protein
MKIFFTFLSRENFHILNRKFLKIIDKLSKIHMFLEALCANIPYLLQYFCKHSRFLELKVTWEGPSHGRMNYKDTKPHISAFLSVDLLTEFAAFCLTDFIDWRYIHSWFVFSTQLVNCCPQGRRNYCAFSLTSFPLPPFPMYSIYRQCVTVGGGGVEMYCGPYSAGVLRSVSDQIQNLQNCYMTPNKSDQ